MSSNTPSAREQARKLHQEQERKQKLQSLLLRVGVVVLALVVVGGLTVFVLTQDDNDEAYTEGPAPAAANEQGGIELTSATELAEGDSLEQVDAENIEDVETVSSGDLPPGVEEREEGEPPHVLIYTDPGCPACGSFEGAYGEVLAEWVEAGAITLEYRSVAWTAPGYSEQGANAFACMAEESPEAFHSYLTQITAVRADGGELTTDDMATVAEDNHGVDISDCLDDGTYLAFGQYTSNLASQNGVQATPTIYVDDEEVPEYMDAGDEILDVVQEYQDETGDEVLEGLDDALAEEAEDDDEDDDES